MPRLSQQINENTKNKWKQNKGDPHVPFRSPVTQIFGKGPAPPPNSLGNLAIKVGKGVVRDSERDVKIVAACVTKMAWKGIPNVGIISFEEEYRNGVYEYNGDRYREDYSEIWFSPNTEPDCFTHCVKPCLPRFGTLSKVSYPQLLRTEVLKPHSAGRYARRCACGQYSEVWRFQAGRRGLS